MLEHLQLPRDGRQRSDGGGQGTVHQIAAGGQRPGLHRCACARGTTSLCRRRLLINLLGVSGTAGYGQDPSAGDQQAWPVFPLTINPSLLRSDNATLVVAFAEALQAAAADNKL